MYLIFTYHILEEYHKRGALSEWEKTFGIEPLPPKPQKGTEQYLQWKEKYGKENSKRFDLVEEWVKQEFLKYSSWLGYKKDGDYLKFLNKHREMTEEEAFNRYDQLVKEKEKQKEEEDRAKKAPFWDLAQQIADLSQELVSKYSLGLKKGRNDDPSPYLLGRGRIEWESLDEKKGSLCVKVDIELERSEKEAKKTLGHFTFGDADVGMPSMLTMYPFYIAEPVTGTNVGTHSVCSVSHEWSGMWGNECKVAFYRSRVFIWLTMRYTPPIAVSRRSKRNVLFSGKDDFVGAGTEVAKAIDENIIGLERCGLL